METPSIKQIKDQSSEIKKSLKKVKSHDFAGLRFGNESEYSDKSIIAGIESILIDLHTLYSAPTKFLKKSTSAERTLISSNLGSLVTYCNNLDLTSAGNILEQIKPIIRSYGVRDLDERRIAFEDHIDTLQKKSLELSIEIENLRSTKEATESALEEMKLTLTDARNTIEKISSSKDSISQNLKESTSALELISSIKKDCEDSYTGIEKSKNDVRNLTAGIEDFFKKISSRELQIDNQNAKSDEYRALLDEFTSERVVLLDEAKSLINSARVALGYKTAQGLSAAFTEKQIKAESDKTTIRWIFAAAIFILGAIGIGIWVTIDSGTAIELVIGRISLIPILIGAAWFSASQYIKQRNLAEEYAYKSVLVRSMVGFSEQVSGGDGKGEDHSHYIKNVLSEIHMNPIRGHADNSLTKKEVIELLKELRDPIVKIAETAVKQRP
ncbi:hypothetical protein NRY95_00750 [Xanthomonas campestris pv. phormiicola]|nr:hypothetical protein [Xanthomonas campestris pv. phormiicola]UYC16551.1 hypothetical protein NRY95_00750 [Xanthomonas campestris pv. phormiicola]